MSSEHADPATVHVSVLRERCVELLAPALQAEGAVYVDATCGMGGHTEAVLEACPAARAVCIDRDEEALALAGRRLERFGSRASFAHASFDHLAEVLAERGIAEVQAVLFDLGVSSLQLDDVDRGFSYRADAPLDMRMDRSQSLTAAEVVNTYEVGRLWTILRRYGEERHARRIAENIGRMRAERPLRTTGDLVRAVETATQSHEHRGHPGKRVFQAIRIEVNGELSEIESAVPQALAVTAVGGRVAVMSFQSLEDRIVKRILREACTTTAPPGLPEIPEDQLPRFRALTRGAEQAGEDERARNRRSASVRLRAVERIRGRKR